MNTKVLKQAVYLLILAVFTTGCRNDSDTDFIETSWSIALDTEDPIIDCKVGDLGIKFCLLNEDSVPANIFKEGENFYFYFAFENFTEKMIGIEAKSFSDFFMIYHKETNELMGKPYSGLFCNFVGGPLIVPVLDNKSTLILLPWITFIENENYWWYPHTIRWDGYPFCSAQENIFIPKGEYSCRWEMDLTYRISDKAYSDDETLCFENHYCLAGILADGKLKKINGLFFEINFKIE